MRTFAFDSGILSATRTCKAIAYQREIAYKRALRVATARADAHENYKSASRRMGALWTAWARVA